MKEYMGLRGSKIIVYEDTLFIKKRSIEKTLAFDDIAGVRFKESGAISSGDITIRSEKTGTYDIAFDKNERDSFRALFDFLREKTERAKTSSVKRTKTPFVTPSMEAEQSRPSSPAEKIVAGVAGTYQVLDGARVIFGILKCLSSLLGL